MIVNISEKIKQDRIISEEQRRESTLLIKKLSSDIKSNIFSIEKLINNVNTLNYCKANLRI